MKKLWLSAIAAACLLAGNAAQAGDHGRRGGWNDDWNHGREYRHCDEERGPRWGWHGPRFAPVVVRPVVYSRPVYYARPVYYERPDYYERPAYEGRAYGGSDGEIHGSVTVGF